MRNILKKTAIATAMSAALFSVPAMASDGTFDFSNGEGTVVFANVMFGEGLPGVGSEDASFSAPDTTFDLVGGVGGDSALTTSVATIKFTLGGIANFATDISTTALLDIVNAGGPAFTVTTDGANAATYEVVQGGSITDNTITIEIAVANDGEFIESMTFGGYDVKNLQDALKASSPDPRVRLAAEYVESDPNGVADDVNVTATDDALVIFASQEPLDLTGTPADFNAGNFIRINVGSGETTFTNGTTDGRTDFDGSDDLTFVTLGTIQLGLEAVDTVAFPDSTGGIVKKENGDDFDFNGADVHNLTFTATNGSFQAGALVYLNASNVACGATATAVPGLTNSSAVVAANGSVTMAIGGNTTVLVAPYNLCYSVNGTLAATVIPEVSGITGSWSIVFFNSEWDNRNYTSPVYGPLLRNGCIASFFNIPASDNASDTAFIRLTNTSTTNAGDIRGTLWAQDGSVIGTADSTIAPSLAIHATQIFSSNAADIPFTGGNIISIENAFGVVPTDFGTGGSRARLVLKGAFDTCEGLGLLRTSGGSLFNMTATTMGNEAAGSNDGNNAQ